MAKRTKKQYIKLLQELIDGPKKDRVKFVEEFAKFRDQYHNGNFKAASESIGEVREKVATKKLI